MEDVSKCLVGQIIKPNSILIVDVGTQDNLFAVMLNNGINNTNLGVMSK